MGLKDFLESKKASIIEKWFEFVINTYAPDAAAFFKKQNDAFSNPVGSITRKTLETLFDSLLEDTNSIDATLEPLIKIRAVQNFTPSQSLKFIFSLKRIIREELRKKTDSTDKIDPENLSSIDAKIDEMALIGFDIFVKSREKIYDLKTNEERNKIYKAFARAGLIKDVSAEESNLKFV